jgi:uncharacterized protein YlxW (UPF0749 family)
VPEPASGQDPNRPPAEDTAPGTQARPESGLARLGAALTSRPSRGQVVAAVLLAALGFAAAVQIRLTHATGDFAGQRRADLVVLLDSLSAATDRAETQINELEAARSNLQTATSRRAAVLAESRRRLAVLRILTGSVAAKGPGVTITIDDPRFRVTAATILNGIEELRDAGAEAIEVNDAARVVASTAFTEKRDVIMVDGVPVHPPYTIDAIGSSHTLSQAVVFPGGLSDEVQSLGGTVHVKEAPTVLVSSLHPVQPPQYSQPIAR